MKLSDQIENATPDQQRQMLYEAWDALNPLPRQEMSFRYAWGVKRVQFDAMIDAGAFESAAMTFIPEGWSYGFTDRRATYPGMRVNAQMWTAEPASTIHGDATTPALAIAAACVRVEETRRERQQG